MTLDRCAVCNSSRIVYTGPHAGALACVMKSRTVNPDSTCPYFFPAQHTPAAHPEKGSVLLSKD